MKQLARTLILFGAAIAAHEFSGGKVIQSPLLLVQLVFVTAVVYCLRSIKLEGPGLALVVLLIQSASHFIIGNGSSSSDLTMTFGHLISGVFSYFGIDYFEKALDCFIDVLSLIVPLVLVKLPPISKPNTFHQTSFRKKINLPEFMESISFRGPPIAGELT